MGQGQPSPGGKQPLHSPRPAAHLDRLRVRPYRVVEDGLVERHDGRVPLGEQAALVDETHRGGDTVQALLGPRRRRAGVDPQAQEVRDRHAPLEGRRLRPGLGHRPRRAGHSRPPRPPGPAGGGLLRAGRSPDAPTPSPPQPRAPGRPPRVAPPGRPGLDPVAGRPVGLSGLSGGQWEQRTESCFFCTNPHEGNASARHPDGGIIIIIRTSRSLARISNAKARRTTPSPPANGRWCSR